jgi:hypothetical protein
VVRGISGRDTAGKVVLVNGNDEHRSLCPTRGAQIGLDKRRPNSRRQPTKRGVHPAVVRCRADEPSVGRRGPGRFLRRLPIPRSALVTFLRQPLPVESDPERSNPGDLDPQPPLPSGGAPQTSLNPVSGLLDHPASGSAERCRVLGSTSQSRTHERALSRYHHLGRDGQNEVFICDERVKLCSDHLLAGHLVHVVGAEGMTGAQNAGWATHQAGERSRRRTQERSTPRFRPSA